ncbi:MAG: hypothetical protein C0404_03100 [Verrucomicrobia bacterium]|nr:hypothetical protein [Verrucomicrobiota bacterium]
MKKRKEASAVWCTAGLTLLLGSGLAGAASLTITADQDLSSGGVLTGTEGGISVTSGDGSSGNPYLYEFASFSDGLIFNPGVRKLFTTGALSKSFRLDLKGGSITGGSSLSINLSTAVAGDMQSSGNITITNAGAISMGIIDAHVDNGNAGSIRVSHRGTLSVGNILTYRINSNDGNRDGSVGSISFDGDNGVASGTKGTFTSGNIGAQDADTTATRSTISIKNYWDVTVDGYIRGHSTTRGGHGVDVTIGTDPVPVGNVTIRGPITLYASSGYGAGSPAYVGNLSISGTGNVLLQNDSGAGQNISGGVGDYGSPGNVTIKHDGQIVFNDISTTTSPGGNPGGYGTLQIMLNGDAVGNGVSGTLAGRDIIGATYAIGRHPSHNVDITGYTSVSLRTVDAGGYLTSNNGDSGSGGQNTGFICITNIAGPITISGNLTTESLNGFSAGTHYAGAITLSASGDITVAGTINANCVRSNAYDGALTLTSGGAISLGSLDMSKVGVTKLDFQKTCVVTGAVLNVAANYTGGNGSYASPYVTTQTALRVPAGKRLVYRWSDVPTNSYLNRAVYRVADLNGSAGSGGLLIPYVPPGTVLTLR